MRGAQGLSAVILSKVELSIPDGIFISQFVLFKVLAVG